MLVDAAAGDDGARGAPRDGGSDVDDSDAGGVDASAVCSAPCAGVCVGGRCLITLATSASPTGIAIDGKSAYFTSCPSGDGGLVLSVPLGGGTPQPLASGPGCPVLAVGAAGLYVAGLNGGDVMSVPVDGGAPTTLASGSDPPIGIAVDGVSAYWTTAGGAVMKVPLDGGTPTVLAVGQKTLSAPAVDVSGVYWATGGTIESAPRGGGSPTLVTTVDTATALAIAGTNVYFAAGYVLMTAPLAGGPATALCTAAGAPVYAVAVDDANVYFTSYAVVYEVPHAGGNPTVLASNQGAPNALAVDATQRLLDRWNELAPAARRRWRPGDGADSKVTTGTSRSSAPGPRASWRIRRHLARP